MALEIPRGTSEEQPLSGRIHPPPRMNPTPSPAHHSASFPPHPQPHRERQRRTRARSGRQHPRVDLLEEVLLAVDAPGPGEAPVSQLHLAVCALEAGAVPVSVQDLQDELVQDVLVAARALGNLCRERRETQCELSAQPCQPDRALCECPPVLPGTERT